MGLFKEFRTMDFLKIWEKKSYASHGSKFVSPLVQSVQHHSLKPGNIFKADVLQAQNHRFPPTPRMMRVAVTG